jgi:DNA-directed RNA polymerase specialized sigma24 family protein
MGKRQRKRQRRQPLSGERSKQTAPHVAAWTLPSLQPLVTSALEELAEVVDEKQRLDERQRALIAELVAAGTSWPRIAVALGVSRQAARQQFMRTHPSRGDSG